MESTIDQRELQVGSSEEGSLYKGNIRHKRGWLRVIYQVYKAYARLPAW